jgi:GMP synthase-like glutamine amidotransferase
MDNRLVIIKNSTSEGPGLLEELLIERKTAFSVIDLNRGDPIPQAGQCRAVAVLGGPDSANDENHKMKEELSFIRNVLEKNIPYLGICLGMQTLVKAAGGSVVKSHVKEAGFRDPGKNFFYVELTEVGVKDPLFQGLGKKLNVFHLHGETVNLSDGMSLLATGKFCRNQAVRVGENAYGLQCHFELTAKMFEDWISTDPDLCALDADELRRDYRYLEESYLKTGKTLLRNFLDIAKI